MLGQDNEVELVVARGSEHLVIRIADLAAVHTVHMEQTDIFVKAVGTRAGRSRRVGCAYLRRDGPNLTCSKGERYLQQKQRHGDKQQHLSPDRSSASRPHEYCCFSST